MCKVYDFLRRVAKSPLVLVARRVISSVVPMKPYPQCGIAPRCPCPVVRTHVAGVAIGNEVNMKL